MPSSSQLIHGTALATPDGVGFILVGGSSTGKSSLAAELLQRHCQLIADDQIICETTNHSIVARAPHNISGLLELSYLSVISVSEHCIAEHPIHLLFECHPANVELPRIAEHKHTTIADGVLDTYPIQPQNAYSAAKLLLFCSAWKNNKLIEELSTEPYDSNGSTCNNS